MKRSDGSCLQICGHAVHMGTMGTNTDPGPHRGTLSCSAVLALYSCEPGHSISFFVQGVLAHLAPPLLESTILWWLYSVCKTKLKKKTPLQAGPVWWKQCDDVFPGSESTMQVASKRQQAMKPREFCNSWQPNDGWSNGQRHWPGKRKA